MGFSLPAGRLLVGKIGELLCGIQTGSGLKVDNRSKAGYKESIMAKETIRFFGKYQGLNVQTTITDLDEFLRASLVDTICASIESDPEEYPGEYHQVTMPKGDIDWESVVVEDTARYDGWGRLVKP